MHVCGTAQLRGGRGVYAPHKLLGEDRDGVVFIILAEDYYGITEQLKSMGFRGDFCYYRLNFRDPVLRAKCSTAFSGTAHYLNAVIENKRNKELPKDILDDIKNVVKNYSEHSFRMAEEYKCYEKVMTNYFNSVFFRKYAAIFDSEFSIYSQWGEDGIIQWILSRLDVKNKMFIEFGVQSYEESNTRFLFLKDKYRGLIIDGDDVLLKRAQTDYRLKSGDLTIVNAFITKDNINQLFADAGFSGEIALLSIDIDGNDYWIWEAIENVSPQVVVCEYNESFGYDRALTVPYDKGFVYNLDGYFGASLKAFEMLGRQKGYTLLYYGVGANCFFIRNDSAECFKDVLEAREKWDVHSKYHAKKGTHTSPWWGATLYRAAKRSKYELWDIENNKLVDLIPDEIY
jgi:hypothetical protein